MAVAGVNRDGVASNRQWASRLEIPYPLLTDAAGEAGPMFGVSRRIALGEWSLELFRRVTFLVDLEGTIAAVWNRVKVRGHATEVLRLARASAGKT